ncbi:MAG: molybdopterin-dependent oxidoreductase [Spirochaetales bacterium]|nr:molybdopterin-dependent oxidoreductase [Spirochaetales bacterium]
MGERLFARPIIASGPGSTVDGDAAAGLSLPHGYTLVLPRDLPRGVSLSPPFESVVILPDRAAYAGQTIAVLCGTQWRDLDRLSRLVPQSLVSQDGEKPHAEEDDDHGTGHTLPHETEDASAPSVSEAAYQIVEGHYETAMQLHAADAPLWAEATADAQSAMIRLPCQWPAHVRSSVAAALNLRTRAVTVAGEAPGGVRDAALHYSAELAVIAALTGRRLGATVTLAIRSDQIHLTGGRGASTIRWVSRLDAEGRLIGNGVTVRICDGAYPMLADERARRVRAAARSVYRFADFRFHSQTEQAPTLPAGSMEGVGTAQVSFAREVHYSRLAELAEEDPIIWRQRHLRLDWPVLQELCSGLADESDFHRRHSANEIVRKRRLQLPRNSGTLKGIGFAMADQISGMTGDKEAGAVSVRLEQDGTARLFCSLPTPTPKLVVAWRAIVAQELGIDLDSVVLDNRYETEQQDSGPRLFSRGVSVVPRAIQSACQAIQKQRFRDPLPIQVRRTIRTSRAMRTPADALHSVGAATIETLLIPSSMEIEVRSVTLAVYAGRIMDRGSAEAELRRGIYQALSWTLHDAWDGREGERSSAEKGYDTSFRGRPPRIKIIFGNPIRKDGPTGIGELPFLTVPAAVVSALSQASGLYLDRIPIRPAQILRMLQEE